MSELLPEQEALEKSDALAACLYWMGYDDKVAHAQVDIVLNYIKKLEAKRTATEAKYHELLFAVETKHPEESRHQTALRYIKNAERTDGEPKESRNE